MQAWIDHLIVAGPDLAEAVEHVRTALGADPEPGGRHPGVGTRNALLGLGPGVYLEVIAPDPAQPEPDLPRWFGIDELTEPRLVTWSARVTDLEAARAAVLQAGVDLGPISRGARERPDGVRLSWRVTDPRAGRLDGVAPFLMDWGESEHPSDALSGDCRLARLRLIHPRMEAVRPVTEALALPVELVPGKAPQVEVEIETPDGAVTLR